MSLEAETIVDGGLAPRKLRQCEQYVESHLENALRVEELARAVNMSVAHFARAFQRSTGKTPHRYVLERRIAVAEVMVANTERPLNEISTELGFCSPSHFSAVFQAITGISPSSHRRQGTPTGIKQTGERMRCP
jgi:AraC family transcriptional regulator